MANINAFLPPGVTSSYRAEIIDSQNVQSKLSNPNTVDKRINLARMQDSQRRQLMEQFEEIDADGNGRITIDEMAQFFTRLIIKEVQERLGPNSEKTRRLEAILQKQDEIYSEHLEGLFEEDDFY